MHAASRKRAGHSQSCQPLEPQRHMTGLLITGLDEDEFPARPVFIAFVYPSSLSRPSEPQCAQHASWL